MPQVAARMASRDENTGRCRRHPARVALGWRIGLREELGRNTANLADWSTESDLILLYTSPLR